MIGDREWPRSLTGRQIERRQIFSDVLGKLGNPRRLHGIVAVAAQHEAVVFYRGSTAGYRDQDGIEPGPIDLAHPGVDTVAHLRQCLLFAAHVVGERAATSLAGRDY